MSSNLIEAVKVGIGLVLGAIAFLAFFQFYKLVLLGVIYNPYIGLLIIVGALVALLVLGIFLSFKVLTNWY